MNVVLIAACLVLVAGLVLMTWLAIAALSELAAAREDLEAE